MNLSKFLVFVLGLSLSNVACSEEAKPLVPKDTTVSELGDAQKAITFSGKLLVFNRATKQYEVPVLNPKPCSLQLTIVEEDSTEDGTHSEDEHGHHMVAQFIEKTPHGQTVPALEVSTLFLSNNGDYFESNELNVGESYIPTFIGLSLEGSPADVDLTQIRSYQDSLDLFNHSFELELEVGTDMDAFEAALEEAIESQDANLSEQLMAALDKLSYTSIQKKHTNHLDPLFCTNFELQPQTSEVELVFKSEPSHGHGH